ncbi:putative phospholipid-binding lipoprotein MlaA [Saliniradius amylolyticus]|uniref:Putative phospholipid-binding lipoprotein MlaA n=1 Tax=Saliniradius amylolyticus TaxID=2183582 RepID=A0A2S2E100_9ALTE|nr:VacJ family lipoprotein [Saliniradius amylolyticus]AWL11314.1 putative phospholipid-binding lipoprotein MlaA [Saliniradius amylolyticus]
MSRIYFIVVISLLLLGGCSSSQQAEQRAEANQPSMAGSDKYEQRDPLEPVNRPFWTLNWDYLDPYLIRPLAVGYKTVMPDFARTGLLNAANNLSEPASALNNLLQGDMEESLISVGRFVVNSTFGLFGTLDVATDMGLNLKEEEFGQTLGVWGVGNGAYLMVPAMGPNDLRAAAGSAVDNAYFPIDNLAWQVNLFRVAVQALEARIDLMAQEQMINGAVDPYAMVRNVYFQKQDADLKDGKVEISREEEELNDDIDAYLRDL